MAVNSVKLPDGFVLEDSALPEGFELELESEPNIPAPVLAKRNTAFMPGTIKYPTTGNAQLSAWKPSAWESLKSAVFPHEVGYGTRPAPISRPEKLFRAVEFGPRTAFTAIGGAIERGNIAATSLVKPLFAAAGKGKLTGLETEELKKYPETVVGGLKTAFRPIGTEAKAPTYGEMLAEEWYEPLTGEEPPSWYAPSQDIAFETTMLFGPKVAATRKRRIAQKAIDNIVSKYNTKINIAQSRGDSEAVKSLQHMEQMELAQLKEPARLLPARFKETWRGVGGKLHKAGKPIAEVPEATARIESSVGIEKPVEKLTRLIKGAKITSKAKLRAQSKARKPKVAEFARELEIRQGDIAFKRAYSKLRGPLTEEGAFVAPKHQMSAAEMTSLVDRLRTTKRLQPLEKGLAWEGLHELFTGNLPQPHKLRLLEREFGKELIKAALSKRTLGQKAMGGFVDVLNLPRTLLTAYDLSASLRQNMLAGVRHPVKWSKAFVDQLKAFGSEKNAIGIDDAIRGSKWYKSAAKHGLYLPDPTGISQVAATRPEEFMSRIARGLPGVKASERAFVTMGNKMRFELYSQYAEIFKKSGIATESNMRQLAHYLNAATGRGDIGFLSRHGASLNALLFSPRYLASRFQVAAKSAQIVPSAAYATVTGGKINPVSKIAAADVTAFVALNTSLLAAIKFYHSDNPDIDVEIDPRSSDFGKIRIGNSRIEPWAGFQPIARHIAQLMTGEKKATITGRISDIERPKVVTRFARSKLAPVPGFIIDAATGKTYVGDEVTMAKLKEVSTENLVYQRFFPLAGQDIVDAIQYQGGGAVALTVPSAILGLGTGTWETTPAQNLGLKQDEVSRRTFGKDWEDAGPVAQNIMRNMNKDDWQELEVQKKFEQKQFGSLEFVAREQKQATENITNRLKPEILSSLEEIQIKVPAVSRRLGDWRMNKERFTHYQNLVADRMNILMAEQVKTKDWRTSSVKIRRKIANNIISQSKEFARNRVKFEANREDFE